MDWTVVVGFLILLSAAYLIFRYLSTRASFFGELREQSKRWGQNNKGLSIRLTDEVIYYQDNEIKTEHKWTLYTSYIIRNNLIILIQQRPFVGDFAIDMSEISQEELQTLQNFLKPMHQYNTGLFGD